MNPRGHKLNNNDVLAFMLAGRSRFTLKSLQTNTEFSFEIRNQYKRENGKKVDNPDLKFVSLFIGANQAVRGRAYAYFGYIVRTRYGWDFRVSPKSKIKPEHEAIKAFNFVFNRLLQGVKLPTLEVWHEGLCACCGKTLKLTESIEIGWGPVCMKRRKDMLEALASDVAERRKEALKILAQSPKTTKQVSKPFTSQTNLFSNKTDYIKK